MGLFSEHIFSTPHTREHQQVGIRGVDRKHLNQVPRSEQQQAKHPLIDRIIKSGRKGRWTVSPIDAKNIVRMYRLNVSPTQDLVKKEINRTGITLFIDNKKRQYYLIKK